MVDSAVLDATFQALAHPTRRGMLALLAQGECSVGELAAPFDVSLAASSKHLQVLERAGLVERRIVGRQHRCRLDPGPLAQAVECAEGLQAVFEANFGRLDTLLGELKSLDKKRPRKPRSRK